MDSSPHCTSSRSHCPLDREQQHRLLDLSDQNLELRPKPAYPQSHDKLNEWITPLSQLFPAIKIREKNRHAARFSERGFEQFSFTESKLVVEPVTYRYARENGIYRDFKEKKWTKQNRRSSNLYHSQKLDKNDVEKTENDVGKTKEDFEKLMKSNPRYFKLMESQVNKEVDPTMPPPVQESQVVVSLIQSNSSRKSTESLGMSTSPLRAKTTYADGKVSDGSVSHTITSPIDEVRCSSIETGSHIRPKNDRLVRKQRQLETNIKNYGHRLRHDQLMVPLGRDAFGVAKVSSNTAHKQQRALKPIERITPSMRENYDNVQAHEKLNLYRETNTKNHTDAITSSWTNSIDDPDSQSIHLSSASIGYRVNKLGESKHKPKESKTTVNDFKRTDFQAFLPSISGKGIGSVSSTR